MLSSEFGTKVVPPERLLKMLPELVDHQNQNVRSTSKCLTFKLCRWIGKDSVNPILFDKMSDAMKKELEAEAAKVTGTAKPTRKIRSAQDEEREPEPKPEPVVVTETTGVGPAEKSISDGIAEQSRNVSRSIGGRVFARENHVRPRFHIERNMLPRIHTGTHDLTDWNECNSKRCPKAGMKVVIRELDKATNAPEGSPMSYILKDVDLLVSILANKVSNNFDTGSCKYVWGTLMKICKTLAHAIQETTFENLIFEILHWLLDERVPSEGDLLLKDLNQLILRILVLKSPLSDVDLDRVLESIHVFLEDLGVEEIRRRTGTADKPLHMVSYVLVELVKFRGPAIRRHLSKVPIDEEPQPIILAYLDLELLVLKHSRID